MIVIRNEIKFATERPNSRQSRLNVDWCFSCTSRRICSSCPEPSYDFYESNDSPRPHWNRLLCSNSLVTGPFARCIDFVCSTVTCQAEVCIQANGHLLKDEVEVAGRCGDTTTSSTRAKRWRRYVHASESHRPSTWRLYEGL